MTIRDHLQNVDASLRGWDNTAEQTHLRQAIGELKGAVEGIYKILEDFEAAGREVERKFFDKSGRLKR